MCGVLLCLWIVSLMYLVMAPSPWEEELRAGAQLKTSHFWIQGLWWAALADLLIATGLLLSGRSWWGKESSASAIEDRPRPSARTRSVGLVLILAAVVYGGVIRAPRLQHGFWNDEEYAYRRYVGGYFEEKDDGRMEFRPVTWEKALFFNHTGNNHLLHTLFSRSSHLLWQKGTGAAEGEFSEAVLRIFPYLWGLGAIGLCGILGWKIGGPGLAAAAAWMLALSPWHIRYSVEARGYSLMVFLLLLLAWLLGRASERDRWCWWLAAAMTGGLCMLAFAGSLYALVPAWGVALLGCSRRGTAQRPIVANLIGLAVCLPLFAPSIPQIFHYLGREDTHPFHFGLPWLRDFFSHLVVGVPPGPQVEGLQLGPDLLSLGPLAGALVWWVFPVLIVAGAVALFFRGRGSSMAVLATFFLSLVLGLILVSRSDSPMHSWYFLFALPAVTLVAPASSLLLKKVFGPIAASGFLAVLVIGYALATHVPRRQMAAVERQSMRATVRQIRAEAPDALTGVFGTSARQCRTYDPASRLIESTTELADLELEARQSNRPLYIYFCGGRSAVERDPELVAEIVDSGRYRPQAELLAFEELFGYKVFALTEK